MPEISKKEIIKAREEVEFEQFRRWWEGGKLPSCSKCDFEERDYCKEHELIIDELRIQENCVALQYFCDFYHPDEDSWDSFFF